MEKEPQPDSLTDVTVKQYAPSEVYSSEPPPAYQRPSSTVIQVAKIASMTFVMMSFILGGFILASSYIQANASCKEYKEELQFLQDEQRMQQFDQAYPEALIQEKSTESTKVSTENPKIAEPDSNDVDDDSESDSEDYDEKERTPVKIKLPLQLDFDDITALLIEKNQKSRMNCVIEKKKAEELIDHQPKSFKLPFGINLTTDQKYERVIGERMAIFCESGDDRYNGDQEETMMVQPIFIPVPAPMAFQMPSQQYGNQAQRAEQEQQTTIYMEPLAGRQSFVPEPAQHQMPPPNNQMPPHPLMQHIAQQIVAHHEMAMARQQEQQQQQQQRQLQQGAKQLMEEQQAQEQDREMKDMSHAGPFPESLLPLGVEQAEQVIVSVAETEGSDAPSDDVHIMKPPRLPIQDRQTHARELHILPLMQQEQQTRPHYVQPRSVDNEEEELREKRMKRCSCDCAC